MAELESKKRILPPKDHPLRPAVDEFYLAADAYERMEKLFAQPFERLDTEWREFLKRVERVYGKAKAGCESQPKWPEVHTAFKRLRLTDPLLIYLRQARNAEEHTIAAIASEWDPQVVTRQAEGKVHVAWQPYDRPLLPVKNRGVTYFPPREHLGVSLEPHLKKGMEEPLVIGDFAMQFYAKFLNELFAKLYPEVKAEGA